MNFQLPPLSPADPRVSIPHTFTTLAPPSTPPLFPSCPGPSTLIDCRPEDPSTVVHYPHHQTSKNAACRLRRRQLISFDMIPDDILLEIFDFYVGDVRNMLKQRTDEWIRLAHVCRRWRSVVFQSPHRLNLRLVCTPRTPTRAIMDIWPPFPLIIRGLDDNYFGTGKPFIEGNIIAALEHNDRVCKIDLKCPALGFFANSAAILEPFPELTFLKLNDRGWLVANKEPPEPILPDSFLGGTAPRLESLILEKVPFPGLPKLLLSTTLLVNLNLDDIPRSGYIPPDVMATSLSALINLESLILHFRYPRPRPAPHSRQPPVTRSILPSLTKIRFEGVSEYLEGILARIDAPRLDNLDVIFFNQIIFDTPQLFQLISRRPTLSAQEKAYIDFHHRLVVVGFTSHTSDKFNIGIRCTPSEWQLSSLGQVCSSLPPVSTLEDLYISEWRIGYLSDESHWPGDVENTLWLDLLRPFVAVKNLHIPEILVPRIAPALQELVGGRTTEVLPALENIFFQGHQPLKSLQKRIEKFVAARRLTSRPVAVSRDKEICGRVRATGNGNFT